MENRQQVPFIQNIAQPSWIGISKGMADLNSYEFISRYAKKTPRHLETVAADLEHYVANNIHRK